MTSSPKKSRPQHKIGLVIGILLCIVLIPILTVNLTMIVKSILAPEKIPDFMGYKPFIVMSGSMEPAVMTGDLIITRQVQPGTLDESDVIAYRYGESSVVTHRIQQVTQVDEQRAFVTKGDANNVEDNMTPTEDRVEGELLWIIPGMGHAAMFLQTPMGLLTAAGLPLLLFFLFDLLIRRRADGREKAKSLLLEEELARVKQQLQEKGSLQGNVDSKGVSIS